ncbi:MAG: spore coat U domain-containing protein [Pseudomonadota bacterium]|nr:spore coat U domain-containing protein [Pseudomonadota bacterium]
MSIFTRTALAVALVAAAPLASAATANDTMLVSITIRNSCTIVANDLAFGSVSTLAANVDASTTVDVTCTGRGPLSIEFTSGTGASATFASRKMTDTVSTNVIDYSLYRDAARTQVLGDGSGGSVTIGGVSTGATNSFPVYGRVPGGQDPKTAGSYSDSVVATVTF